MMLSASERQTALAVLGLPNSATPEQITAVYRRLAKATHPDTTGRTDAEAARRFEAFTRAYRRLTCCGTDGGDSSDRSSQRGPVDLARPIAAPPAGPVRWPRPPLVAGPVHIRPAASGSR